MSFIDIIIWYLVFIFSTVVHEASHAFTAFKFGDPTAYNNGQLSLNPLPHLKREPMGTIVIPFISLFSFGWMIGWAKTPYSLRWADSNTKKAGLMSVTGPLSNLFLLLLTSLLIHLGIDFGLFNPHPFHIKMSSLVFATNESQLSLVTKILSIMFSMNLILFIFNILPVPPLDGSGIPLIFLSNDKGKRYLEIIRKPPYTFIGLFAAWLLFGFVFSQIFIFTINLLYPGGNYQ